MSANNYILVKEIEPDVFEVGERDVDTDQGGKPVTVKTFKQAAETAFELQHKIQEQGGYVEYGIRIDLLKKNIENEIEKPPNSAIIKANVEHCARCKGNHEQLDFYHFTNPVIDDDGFEWSYYGECPVTKEPILMTEVGLNGNG